MAALSTPLNDKQKRFVEEYLIDFNGSQAAIRSGYSEKTARIIASQNLAKPNIAAAIAAKQAKIAEKLEVTVESIVAELEEARNVAVINGQSAGMVAASMGKAKVCGLIIDRAVNDTNLVVHEVSALDVLTGRITQLRSRLFEEPSKLN